MKEIIIEMLKQIEDSNDLREIAEFVQSYFLKSKADS